MSERGEIPPSNTNFRKNSDFSNVFKSDGKVDKQELESVTQMYLEDKKNLQNKTHRSLRGFINSDYRRENEEILGGGINGIKNLQKFLNEQNISARKLKIDGLFGPETFFALLQFQNTSNTTIDGLVSDTLRLKIESFLREERRLEAQKTRYEFTGNLSSPVAPEYSSRVGLRSKAGDFEVFPENTEKIIAEKARLELLSTTRGLARIQRRAISLESQFTSLQTFIENEVGLIESIGDSVAKVSLPFTGKKLTETGEDVIDAQITEIRQSAIALQSQLIKEFPPSKVLSPDQEAIVSDIFDRISRLSQFRKQDKSWSDLMLTTYGGKDMPLVVLFHRLTASIPEGAYKTVEGIFQIVGKSIGLLAAYGIEPAARKLIEEEVLRIIKSLNYESLVTLVHKIPELLEAIIALPPDKKIQELGRLIGALLVPIGGGKILSGIGTGAVTEGSALAKAGIENMRASTMRPRAGKKISRTDDFADTIPMEYRPATPAIKPAAPMQQPSGTKRTAQFVEGATKTLVGGAEIAVGATVVGVGTTVRATEFDVRRAPVGPISPTNKSQILNGGNIPKKTKTTAPSELKTPIEITPKITEVTSDVGIILKDIRSLRSYFHADKNMDAVNIGDTMRRITDFKDQFDAEIRRLKTLHNTTNIDSLPISPELRRIKSEIENMKANKEHILKNPKEALIAAKEANLSKIAEKGDEVRRAYALGIYKEGSTEFYKRQIINEMTHIIQEGVREERIAFREAIAHLEELKKSPAEYIKKSYGLSLEEEVMFRRDEFRRLSESRKIPEQI